MTQCANNTHTETLVSDSGATISPVVMKETPARIDVHMSAK